MNFAQRFWMRVSDIQLKVFGWLPGYKRYQRWNREFIQKHPKYCVFATVYGAVVLVGSAVSIYKLNKQVQQAEQELDDLARRAADLQKGL